MAALIRTITTGVTLGRAEGFAGWSDRLTTAVKFLESARAKMTAAGFEVQTIRLTTNSFEVCGVNDRSYGDLNGIVLYSRSIAMWNQPMRCGKVSCCWRNSLVLVWPEFAAVVCGADVEAIAAHVSSVNASVLINIGPARKPATVALIPELMERFRCARVTCTAAVEYGVSTDAFTEFLVVYDMFVVWTG